MTWNEYKKEAERTFAYHKYGSIVDQLHCAIGIVTEIEELKYAWKGVQEGSSPYIEPDTSMKNINAREELGDILWYIANLERLIETPEYDFNLKGVTYPLEILDSSAANLLDIYKKALYYNRIVKYADVTNLIYMIRTAADSLCYSNKWITEDIMDNNINKLRIRFPEKFTDEKANNRNIKEEYKALTKK